MQEGIWEDARREFANFTINTNMGIKASAWYSSQILHYLLIVMNATRGLGGLLFLCSFLCCAWCDDIFVSATSDYSIGCGSMQKPCGSISEGVQAACHSNSSFSTVWVEPGTYNITSAIVTTCNIAIR